MANQDVPRERLAELAAPAIELADFLESCPGGKIGNDVLPFGVLHTQVGLALVPLAEFQALIWTGWPLDVPALVADVAGVHERLQRQFFTTAAKYNANPGLPRFPMPSKVSEHDVQLLRRAGERLSSIAGGAAPAAAPDDDQDDAAELLLEGVLELGGDDLRRAVAIASNKSLGGEDRMIQLLQLNPHQFEPFDSPRWGKILGVSDAAVRGYTTWQAIQTRKRA